MSIFDLIEDPDFVGLGAAEKLAFRRRYFRERVATDPDFKSLSPKERIDFGRQIIFEAQPDPARLKRNLDAAFAEVRAKGAPAEIPRLRTALDDLTSGFIEGIGFEKGPPQTRMQQTAAELGGVESSFLSDPFVQTALLVPSAPGSLPILAARMTAAGLGAIRGVPVVGRAAGAVLPAVKAVAGTPVPTLSTLFGGRGSSVLEQSLRGAGTLGAFEAVAGAEEGLEEGILGGVRGAAGGAARGAAFGAAFGPALSPVSRSALPLITPAKAILKPMAIGGGVGFVTEGTEGIIPSALMFAGFKGFARGAEGLLRGTSRGLNATKQFFKNRGKGQQDAPRGFTAETFREGRSLEQAQGSFLPPPEMIGVGGQIGRAPRQISLEERLLQQAQGSRLTPPRVGDQALGARVEPTEMARQAQFIELTEQMRVEPNFFLRFLKENLPRIRPVGLQGGPPLLPPSHPRKVVFEVTPEGVASPGGPARLAEGEQGIIDVLRARAKLPNPLSNEERRIIGKYIPSTNLGRGKRLDPAANVAPEITDEARKLLGINFSKLTPSGVDMSKLSDVEVAARAFTNRGAVRLTPEQAALEAEARSFRKELYGRITKRAKAAGESLRAAALKLGLTDVQLSQIKSEAKANFAAPPEPAPLPVIRATRSGRKDFVELPLASAVKKLGGIKITGDIPGELRALVKDKRLPGLTSKKADALSAEEIAREVESWLDEPSSDALLAALRVDATGKRVFSRFSERFQAATGKAAAAEAEALEMGQILTSLKRENSLNNLRAAFKDQNPEIAQAAKDRFKEIIAVEETPGNLIGLLEDAEPQIQLAAIVRLEQLGFKLQALPEKINPAQLSPRLREVLEANLGKKPIYSKDEVLMGEKILKQAEKEGALKAGQEVAKSDKPVPIPDEQLSAEEKAAADEIRGLLGGEREGPPKVKKPQPRQQLLPETPQREIPSGGIPVKQRQALTPLEEAAERAAGRGQQGLFEAPIVSQEGRAFLQAEKPTVAQEVLGGLPDREIEALINEARAMGRSEHQLILEREFSNRQLGSRPQAANPADDLAKAEAENSVAKTLFDIPGKILKNEGGFAMIGHDPNSTALSDDFVKFVQALGQKTKGAFDVERAGLWAKALIRTISAQELAAEFPKTFGPVYKAYHDFPIIAQQRFTEDIAPLFRQARLEEVLPAGVRARPTYMTLPDDRRKLVNDLGILHREKRQGQGRMSFDELKRAGLTDDEVTIFGEVLDYGELILRRYHEGYAEFKTELALRGMGERAAEARALGQGELGFEPQVSREALMERFMLEAKQAIPSIDHWVPFYRVGQKTVVVRDAEGALQGFHMLDNTPLIGREQANLINELRAKVPQGYTVEGGTLGDFVKSRAFEEIDLGSLEMLSKLGKTDPAVREAFLESVRPLFFKRSKYFERQLHAKNIPGFKEDLKEGLIQTGEMAHNYLERQKAFRIASEAKGQIPTDKREIFEFTDQYIRDQMTPGNKALSELRNMIYVYLLGGQFKQFAVQMMQMPTVVWPEMLKDVSAVEAGQFLTGGMKSALSDLNKLIPIEKAAVREGFRQQLFRPRAELFAATIEGVPIIEKIPFLKGLVKTPPFPEVEIQMQAARAVMAERPKFNQYMQQLRDTLMFPVTDADMKGRLASFIAFHRIATSKLKMTPAQAIEYAAAKTKATNFLYGKAENPQLFSRGGPGAKELATFLNVFRTWPTNYASYLRGNLRQEEYKVVGASLAMMFGLGGVLYSPMGRAYDFIARQFGGDAETGMRRIFTDKWGLPQPVTEAILRGAPAALKVDMSRSIAIGDILPEPSVLGIAGAPGAVAENLRKGGIQFIQSFTQPFGPERADAIELMSPALLRNTMRGTRFAYQGLQTKRGGKLPGGDLSPFEIGLQFAGFTPTKVSRARALQRAEQGELSGQRFAQSRATEDFARAMLSGNFGKIQQVQEKINRVNQKALRDGRPDKMIILNQAALRQRIAEMLDPRARLRRIPRRARARVLERERIFGVQDPGLSLGPPLLQ